MKLICPDCDNLVPMRYVDLDKALATCQNCQTSFGFSVSEKKEKQEMEQPRKAAPRPNSIDMQDTGKSLHISMKWLSAKFYFLVVFCIAWDSFLIMWYGIAFSTGEWVMAIFASLHTAVGMGLTYYTVCGFINKTRIDIESEQVSVSIAPLPWPGHRSINCIDIEQLFCKRIISRGRRGTSVSYEVHVVLRNDTRIMLLSGLNTGEEALYIEQEIESFLGINPQRVVGDFV